MVSLALRAQDEAAGKQTVAPAAKPAFTKSRRLNGRIAWALPPE
jgi:hypothetical protein